MATRIDGNNVTQFDKLNVNSDIYVNGQQLVLAGATPIDPRDQWTQLNAGLHITGILYLDGTEQAASGPAIPSTFAGSVLTNVNVTESLAINGDIKFTA